MPANKNQHFVPRCHLKPFSLDGNGVAINVFNRVRDLGVQNVPVKGQCSKDYFYGRDLELEKILTEMEGLYAATLTRVSADLPTVDEGDLSLLRSFAHLQMSRTENTVKRRTEAIKSMDELAYRGKEEFRGQAPDTSHQRMVNGSMWLFAKTARNLSDLDVVLLRNKTKRDFVTSDDPAILTNRLHMQRLGGAPFGLISTGSQLTMPLTPRLALLCYDKTAYAAPTRTNTWIDITRPNDVLALNELQYISCASNIFFRRWEELEDIRRHYAEAASNRPAQWTNNWVGVLEWENEKGEFYRRATEQEIESKVTQIIQTSPVYPNPSRWLSVLPMRQRVYGHYNGSGAGYVRLRQAELLGRAHELKRTEIVRRAYDPAGPKTAFHRK